MNCQPKEYWIDLFAEQGVMLDDVATQNIKIRWRKLQRLSHMCKNVMVFR